MFPLYNLSMNQTLDFGPITKVQRMILVADAWTGLTATDYDTNRVKRLAKQMSLPGKAVDVLAGSDPALVWHGNEDICLSIESRQWSTPEWADVAANLMSQFRGAIRRDRTVIMYSPFSQFRNAWDNRGWQTFQLQSVIDENHAAAQAMLPLAARSDYLGIDCYLRTPNVFAEDMRYFGQWPALCRKEFPGSKLIAFIKPDPKPGMRSTDDYRTYISIIRSVFDAAVYFDDQSDNDRDAFVSTWAGFN